MRKIIFMLVISLVIFEEGAFSRQKFSPEFIFYKANQLYKQQKFEEAIREYQKILDKGYESGNLYYNLGNCYYRKGDLPRAILYYEKAKVFIPEDPDLEANYKYVLSLLPKSYEPPPPGILKSLLQKIFGGFTLQGLFIFLSIIQSLFFLLLLLRLFFKPLKTYSLSLLLLLVFIFFSGSGYLFFWVKNLDKKAVVVKEKVEAKFAPYKEATTHFFLLGGEKVIILSQEGDWLKIKRLDGKIGWLKKGSLEPVRRSPG